MMFHELECGVIINLSMIVEIDNEEGKVSMANGSVWHLNDKDIDAIIKRIKP